MAQHSMVAKAAYAAELKYRSATNGWHLLVGSLEVLMWGCKGPRPRGSAKIHGGTGCDMQQAASAAFSRQPVSRQSSSAVNVLQVISVQCRKHPSRARRYISSLSYCTFCVQAEVTGPLPAVIGCALSSRDMHWPKLSVIAMCACSSALTQFAYAS